MLCPHLQAQSREPIQRVATGSIFLSSPSQLFRPVDIAFGFDGAMYVSDFCSRIIGHAQNAMRDPRWDAQAGRIWRIVHKGRPIVEDWPEIKSANSVQLLELLNHQQTLSVIMFVAAARTHRMLSGLSIIG